MDHHYDMELKAYDLPRLLTLLQQIESRLGTVLEQPKDLERAQTIAHRINNLYTVETLLRSLSKKSPENPTPEIND